VVAEKEEVVEGCLNELGHLKGFINFVNQRLLASDPCNAPVLYGYAAATANLWCRGR
jgi:hypothetical protein